MSKINISELKRIVKLANDLDGKGLHKEADLLDSVIAGFKKMAEGTPAETNDLNELQSQENDDPKIKSLVDSINSQVFRRYNNTPENSRSNMIYQKLRAASDLADEYIKAYKDHLDEPNNQSKKTAYDAAKTAYDNAFKEYYNYFRASQFGNRDGVKMAGNAWQTNNVLYELPASSSREGHIIYVMDKPADGQPARVKSTLKPPKEGTAPDENSDYVKAIRMGYAINNTTLNGRLDKIMKDVFGVEGEALNTFRSSPPAAPPADAAAAAAPADAAAAAAPADAAAAPADAAAAPAGAQPPAGAAPPAGAQPPAGAGGKVDLRSAINSLAEGSMTVSKLAGGTCYMMPSPQGGNKGKEIGVFVSPRFETPLPYVIRKKTGDNLRIIREGRGWSPFGGISQTEKRQLESFKLTVQDMIKSSLEARPQAGSPPAAQPPAAPEAAPAPAPEAPAAPEAAPAPEAPADREKTRRDSGIANPPALGINNVSLPASLGRESLTKKYSYFSKGIIRR